MCQRKARFYVVICHSIFLTSLNYCSSGLCFCSTIHVRTVIVQQVYPLRPRDDHHAESTGDDFSAVSFCCACPSICGVHGLLAPPCQLGQRRSIGTPAIAELTCRPQPVFSLVLSSQSINKGDIRFIANLPSQVILLQVLHLT